MARVDWTADVKKSLYRICQDCLNSAINSITPIFDALVTLAASADSALLQYRIADYIAAEKTLQVGFMRDLYAWQNSKYSISSGLLPLFGEAVASDARGVEQVIIKALVEAFPVTQVKPVRFTNAIICAEDLNRISRMISDSTAKVTQLCDTAKNKCKCEAVYNKVYDCILLPIELIETYQLKALEALSSVIAGDGNFVANLNRKKLSTDTAAICGKRVGTLENIIRKYNAGIGAMSDREFTELCSTMSELLADVQLRYVSSINKSCIF